jgi:predicted RNA methylase
MTVLFAAVMVLFFIVISASWTNYKGAPWVPSSMKVVNQMLELADIQPDELVYDLGCGDGRLVIAAARKYQARGIGIELDPLRWLWCQLMIRIYQVQDQVEIQRGDLFKMDLSDADVVACYLLPETNKKLENKLMKELRPGTRVVTNTFIFYQTRLSERNGKALLYIFSPENTQVEFIKDQLKRSKITLP